MNEIRTPSEWEVAMGAQAEMLGWMMSAYGARYRNAWLNDRDMQYGHGAMIPSAAALLHVTQDIAAAEPIFITGEMQNLVYIAMGNFKVTEPIHEEDFFLRSGFAYLDSPFMSKDSRGKTLAWRAISWKIDWMYTAGPDTEGHIEGKVNPVITELNRKITNGLPLNAREQAILSTMNHEQVLRIVLWSKMDDPDDYAGMADEVLNRDYGMMKWGIAHATSLPLSSIHSVREMRGEGDDTAAWLTFFRVMQKLLAEKLVTKTRYKAHRTMRKFAKRNNLNVNDVLVVELRRKEIRHAGEETGEAANYSHRFIVHGFWRNQYYPSLRVHKQKYIMDYVKGPNDKPLIIKKRVWVWDR